MESGRKNANIALDKLDNKIINVKSYNINTIE